MSSKEKINAMVSQLMIRVKKQVEVTNGIINFENLLFEINDLAVVKSAVVDLHCFLDYFNHVTSETDKLSDRALIAKILSYEFLTPQRFFKHSKNLAAYYIRMNRVLVSQYKVTMWEIGHDNRLGNVLDEPIFKRKIHFVIESDKVNEQNEECRKVILLWNYLPMIVKAILQTKKRSVGIDNNSSKFNQEK